MTKKKRECWEYVGKTILTIGGSKEKRAFDYAFDRAYALGKQEIKQEIKQEKDADYLIAAKKGDQS